MHTLIGLDVAETLPNSAYRWTYLIPLPGAAAMIRNIPAQEENATLFARKITNHNPASIAEMIK